MSQVNPPVAGTKIRNLIATGVYEQRYKNKRNVTYWQFDCEHGNSVMLPIAAVKQGKASCGCKTNGPQQEFYGFLKPTGVVESRMCGGGRTRIFWECECTRCGSMVFSCRDNIVRGHVKSCVCAKKVKGRISTRKYPPVDARASAIVALVSAYRCSAVKRKYLWGLTNEQFVEITGQNCHYCGIEPRQRMTYRTSKLVVEGAYIYNGIDRQDNDVGYQLGNVVPCCGLCNQMKMDVGYEEFLILITNIYNNRVVTK